MPSTAPLYPRYACRLSDRSITLFGIKPSGAFVPLPHATVTVPGDRSVNLVRHPSGRYLYTFPVFNVEQDGYTYEDFSEGHATPRRSMTMVYAYRVEANGHLSLIQCCPVPRPIGEIQAHPSGKYLYAPCGDNRMWLLPVADDGTLSVGKQLQIASGMGLMDVSGERDGGGITISPDGGYVYSFIEDGFVDHSENFLCQYPISRDGLLPEPDQEPLSWEWWSHDSTPPQDVTHDPGWVWTTPYRTALVFGTANRPWVCAIGPDGQLQATGTPQQLPVSGWPTAIAVRDSIPIVAHPRYPFLYYSTNLNAPRYVISKVVAPGRLKTTGRFTSAFGAGEQAGITISSNSEYLYEFGCDSKHEYTLSYAIFRCLPNGRVMLYRRPTLCPPGLDRGILFLTPP